MNTYSLAFDRGANEVIEAESSTAAVAARANPLLPHTISDLTALETFVGRRGYADVRRKLLDEDAPRFERAKELA